jgi:hypothetical protein
VVGGGIVVWLTVISLGVNFYLMKNKTRVLDSKIQKVQTELTNRQESEFFDWGNQFNQMVKSAGLIDDSRKSLSMVLQKLSELMPKNVQVTSFSYRVNKKWSMSGTAISRNDVLVLDKKLKESEVFTDTNLYFSSLESNEGVVFRFSGGSNGR